MGQFDGNMTPEADAIVPTHSITVKKAKVIGEELYVTLQSHKCDELIGSAMRQLAYAERIKHGFESGGIGSESTTYCVDLTQQDEDGLPGKPVDPTAKNMRELSSRKEEMGFETVVMIRRGLR